MRSCGVHHVGPGRLVDRAQPALLPRPARARSAAIGVGEVEGERGETIWYLWGTGQLRSACGRLRPTATRPFDRYRVGLHHLALEASSRQAVNERADWLRSRAPRSRAGLRSTGYHARRYYAVFFYDPDGSEVGDRAHPRPRGLTKARVAWSTTLRSSPPDPARSMGIPNLPAGARMPIPGNAEFALVAVARDLPGDPALRSTPGTSNELGDLHPRSSAAFYLLSRGIAKASRVLEHVT